MRVCVWSRALFWGGEGKRNLCVCEKFFLTHFNHRALCSDECLAGRERKRKLQCFWHSQRYLQRACQCVTCVSEAHAPLVTSYQTLESETQPEGDTRSEGVCGSLRRLGSLAQRGTVGTMGSVMCESTNFSRRFKEYLLPEVECACFVFLFIYIMY